MISLGLFLIWFCKLAWEQRLGQQRELCLEGALLITGVGEVAPLAWELCVSGDGVLGWALGLQGPAVHLEGAGTAALQGSQAPGCFLSLVLHILPFLSLPSV